MCEQDCFTQQDAVYLPPHLIRTRVRRGEMSFIPPAQWLHLFPFLGLNIYKTVVQFKVYNNTIVKATLIMREVRKSYN